MHRNNIVCDVHGINVASCHFMQSFKKMEQTIFLLCKYKQIWITEHTAISLVNTNISRDNGNKSLLPNWTNIMNQDCFRRPPEHQFYIKSVDSVHTHRVQTVAQSQHQHLNSDTICAHIGSALCSLSCPSHEVTQCKHTQRHSPQQQCSLILWRLCPFICSAS